MTTALVLILAYLLGSVPFGLLVTRMAGAGDVRAIGSGNIGATNVLRTGRKGLAAATLLLDMLKGTAAVLLAQWTRPDFSMMMVSSSFMPDAASLAAVAVLMGHVFPVWLRFRGGKGVATALGVMIALHWPTALLAALTWLATAALLRLSSASALVALAASLVYLSVWERFDLLPVCAAIVVIVYIRHHENIVRLIKGTEPKIGKS